MDPLANRLITELRAIAGSRRKLLAAECEDALVEAAPWLRWDPALRRRLAELLSELEQARELTWSVTRDASIRPALPRFVTLASLAPAVAEPAGVGFPWRPELEWAHNLRLTSDDFEALTAIQTFLRD